MRSSCNHLTLWSATALVALFLVILPPAHAQTLAGDIDITVRDQTGAVVPNAMVMIRRSGTATVVRALSSNAEGVAQGALLEPGTYDISAEAKGFKTITRRDIRLSVAQVVSLELELTPGTITQSVTVVGSSPQIEEKAASLAQGFGDRDITNLPLNGRNYLDLGKLAAGAVPSRGSRDQTFAAYGNNGIQNAFVLDGERNNNYIRGLDNRQRDELRPPLDALEEFSVQTSNFSAEYGASAGAVVLAVTKGGTNQVHGSAYEYVRNDHFDARTFINAPPDPKPVYIRNQFGGSLGGPIKKDRAWIFGAYERTSERNHIPSFSTVPTAAERQGIFPLPLYDPYSTQCQGRICTRSEFPSSIVNGATVYTIPSSMFDPVGQALLDRYPLPNRPGTFNNYSVARPDENTENNAIWRGDLQPTARNNFFVRYSLEKFTEFADAALPPPAQMPVLRHDTTNGIGVGYTHTFSPTVINELRFGWTRLTSGHDETLPRDEIIPGSLDPAITRGIPTLGVDGFAGIGDQPGGLGNNPISKSSGVWDTSDNVSWSKGKHLIKFGADWQVIRPSTYSTLNGRGSFGFNGVFTDNPQNPAGTGSSAADLLLGIANTATIGTVVNSIERGKYFGLYGQDRWSATSNLTLTLGLRYELFYPYTEVHNAMANFILDSNDPSYGQYILAGDPRKPRGLLELDKKDFGPRIGLAYRVPQVSGLVVRAAYGIFYGQDAGFGVTTRMTNNPPFFGFGGQSITSDQLDPLSGVILKTASFTRPAPINPQSFMLDPKSTAALRSWDQRNLTPYVQEWNFSLEKQLPWNVVWEADYVGNIGIHLFGEYNANQPLVPGPGTVNSRRPLVQYTDAQVMRVAPFNRSTYEGLSTRLQKQFSNGLSFLSTFTWGRAFDWQNEALDVCDNCGPGVAQDFGFLNSYDLRNNRAPSYNDARLQYNFAAVWSLPFGPGRRFASRGAAAKIAGGWEGSGIFTARTGFPLTITLSRDVTNVGGQPRPDRLCSGQLGDPTTAEWFDTSCFMPPAQYTYGNSGRDILSGPGLSNIDLTLMRNFHVGIPSEAGRLQFRANFFSLLNHPHLGDPGTVFGNPGFGIISSALGNRQIEFALRWVF